MSCIHCRSNDIIHTWRRNTMYADDKMNLITCCYQCILADDYDIYYKWCEYYGYTPNKKFNSDRKSEDYVK